MGKPSLSYPWIGLDAGGVGVIVEVGIVGGTGGGVLLLLPMVAHRRSSFSVNLCISLILLVGCISCSG